MQQGGMKPPVWGKRKGEEEQAGLRQSYRSRVGSEDHDEQGLQRSHDEASVTLTPYTDLLYTLAPMSPCKHS